MFVKVLEDPDKLGILGGVDMPTWKKWAEKFESENPTMEAEAILEKQHMVMRPSAMIQLYDMLVSSCMVAPDKWEMLFDAAEVPRLETLDESIKALKKKRNREDTAYKIRLAEYERFSDELKESKDETKSDIFDILASMGSITGKHYDYLRITVGEFLAEQRLCERLTKEQSKTPI